ncbi:PREDICTED: ATPase family AAA domain-containing protein 2-like isoform X1 [Priapulus caudatus]|uniref:ATPase family AAA domain-containing protein 2-like isoform X1 n=2 Tax=Priapulus caudatus TaxID=37621 RepID=A0ABM1E4K5_PRICU|nr:PREDICTED: ATPase family AAA domain-containing protein 2-like isoform X1 [Priapulus caudatus]
MVKTRHQEVTSSHFPNDFLTISSRRSRRSTGIEHHSDEYGSDGDGSDTTVMTFPKRRGVKRMADTSSSSSEDEEVQMAPMRTRRSKQSARGNDGDKNDYRVMNGDSGIRRSTRQRRMVYDTLNMSTLEKHLQSSGNTAEERHYHSFEKVTSARHEGIGSNQLFNGTPENNDNDNDDDNTEPEESGIDRHTPRTTRQSSKAETSSRDQRHDDSRSNMSEKEKRARKKHLIRELRMLDISNQNLDQDMYSRVKRERRSVVRNMYGIPVLEQRTGSTETSGGSESDDEGQEEEEEEENEEGEDDDDDDEEEEEEGNAQSQRKSYFLRTKKPPTNLFQIPLDERKSKKRDEYFRTETPPPGCHKQQPVSYRSPARKSNLSFKRKKHAIHSGSSTSSSSGSSSDDEQKFQRRKVKSMARARNRCLPMNFRPEDLTSNVILRDRVKIGSSLADVDPMKIDSSVTFESVGGLGKHVRALKEMVAFPLMYPEVFERFKISPPRGVLFYGPPGTGKTLVARALANECSHGDKRVAFFMRKGADCLSKWVGESERQLRLLFDQAYQLRPSIIFFDEIDGLAPVRSSRQDQIHSSIVSTLLALMDGLDGRGEIVIIGATNRIDSIDPALRRPGRFDREFLFPLPSEEARRSIIKIHTKNWNPPLSDAFLSEMAKHTVGYCGADVTALITEAALLALRRRYPQIYTSKEKLQLDVSSINISAKNFHDAMQVIVPTSQRSVVSPGRALSATIRPLLHNTLQRVMKLLHLSFPSVLSHASSVDMPQAEDCSGSVVDLFEEDSEDEGVSIFATAKPGCTFKNGPKLQSGSFCFTSSRFPPTHRPRLLLAGRLGDGHTSHLAPAVLHCMERVPVHRIDLQTLYGVSAKSAEESCTQIFREARCTCPSVVYLPQVEKWWDVISDTLRATFLTLLADLEPSAPVLLLATTDDEQQLQPEVRELFDMYRHEVVRMQDPNAVERHAFFSDLIIVQAAAAPPRRKNAAKRALEVLQVAPPPAPRTLTEVELKRVRQEEESTMRELRLFLRDILNKLARDRRFLIFTKPVDIEEVPDYMDVIRNPMDLQNMMSKIDTHRFQTVQEFMDDVNLIVTNALEYNPDRDPSDRLIRHRACMLRDTANAIIEAELDPEFERICERIIESRKSRGETPTKNAPNFYRVMPPNSTECAGDAYPTRYSRRVRGMDAADLEERQASSKKAVDATAAETKQERALLGVKTEPPAAVDDDAQATEPCTAQHRPATIGDKETRPQQQQQQQHQQHSTPVSRMRNVDYLAKRKRVNVWCRPKPRRSMRYSFLSGITYAARPRAASAAQHSSVKEDAEYAHDKAAEPTAAAAEVTTATDAATTAEEDAGGAAQEDQVSLKRYDKDNIFERMTAIEECPVSPGHLAVADPVTSPRPSLERSRSRSPGIECSGPVGSGGNIEAEESQEEEVVLMEMPRKAVQQGSPPQETCPSSSDPRKDTPVSIRVTRALASDPHILRAREILSEPTQPLIVDQDRLQALLESIVVATEHCNVESLERLHVVLGQCVYKHRKDHDKTILSEEMELELRRFAQHKRRASP